MLIATFPTNYELDIVTQEYTIQRDAFTGQIILPFVDHHVQRVRWDEKDSERGMTSPHAMDADPKVDKRPGSKTREYEPIPFKQTDLIKESELLRARELGTLAGSISLDRLVADTMKARVDKTYIRAEWLRWKTLTGGFTINENGVKVTETFPVQTYNAAIAWSACHGYSAERLQRGEVDVQGNGRFGERLEGVPESDYVQPAAGEHQRERHSRISKRELR